jgi:hypothetical protein
VTDLTIGRARASRSLLKVGMTVRLAGVAMLAVAFPMVVKLLPHPGWSLALVAVVGLQGVAVVVWWLRRGEITQATVFSDLPLGALSLFVGPLLAAHATQPGWTMLAIPYTVFVSFSCGLICRTLPGSIGVGTVWAGGAIAGGLLFGSVTLRDSVLLVGAYLIIPAVGWISARLMRLAANALERAQSEAVREAAELAAARERASHQAALHDRILQTLEVLSRGAVIPSAQLRERVRAQAIWLRSYVESGQSDENLTTNIAAAIQEALPGTKAEINDATMLARGPATGIGPDRRAALVAAVRRAAAGFAGVGSAIVVRTAEFAGGVLVSLVSEDASVRVTIELDDAGPPFRALGGTLTVDPPSCAELWMPYSAASPR